MATAPVQKPFQRIPTNYQDEFIQQIKDRYSLTVSPSSGKSRNLQSIDGSGPSTEFPRNNFMNKIGFEQQSKMNRKRMEHQPPSKIATIKMNRKRKLHETDCSDTISVRKRRKLESMNRKLKQRSESVADSSVTDSELGQVKSDLNLKKNYKLCQIKKKEETGGEMDKNCNLVKKHKSPEDVRKQMNIYDFYSNSCKDLSASSPFKGKMSAFEISLLKGKQSQERRKSMEAATLRSSPRLNSNIQEVQRTAKRSARSLTPSLNDKSLTKRCSKIKRDKQKRKILRNRSKSLGAVSPSSIENQLVTSKVKSRKRSIRKLEKDDGNSKNTSPLPKIKRHRSLHGSSKPAKSPSSPTLTYRMNGSPKLKGLPSVISLSSLSGVPLKVQGSSFSSTIQQRVYANNISGTPPSLSTMKTAALINETSTCVPHARPSTLSLAYAGKETVTANDIRNAFKHCNQSMTNKPCSRLRQTYNGSTEQTETLPSSEDEEIQFKFNNTSPAILQSEPKEDKASRSSRSCTPNISPVKSELLTPSCTPCSTPKKSPSPSLSDHKISKKNKKKNYLFAKYDDVLARWHDGLFYVGTILKINELNQKCLLRYEDNSEYWSLFKDIHRIVNEEEICCLCLEDVSEAPNEIVICDHCNQGFHQQCHAPGIDPKHTVDPDEDWFCRQCVFLITAKTGGALKEGNKADDLRKMKQVLPYSLSSLTWDVQHKSNSEQMYCYCGGPGIWYQKMLQCCRCKQWFHEACLQCLDYPFLFGDSFFIFVCSPCNFGQEYIKRLDVEWPDITHIVLFNLSLERRRKYFDLEEEIFPWIDENWNCLRLNEKQDVQKTNIESHVTTVLQDSRNSSGSRFANGSESRKRHSSWGLRTRVPPPRIQVDLPIKDMLNDNVMKKLQIKGRRSKVFIPLECKSPVKKICESPSRSNIAGRNFNPHFNEKPIPKGYLVVAILSIQDGYHKLSFWKRHSVLTLTGSWKISCSVNSKNDGTSYVLNTKDQVSAKQSRKHLKLPLLDKLIPACTFTSYNHPFKTEIEQSCDRDQLNLRQKILDNYQNSMEEKYGDVLCDETIESASDGPPVLEKMEPVVPKQNNNSSMPVIKNVKKKGKMDSPREPEKDVDRNLKRRSSRKISNPPNLLESSLDKAEKLYIKKVKSADGNYFCAYDKLGIGQGFYVRGRRVNGAGKEEHLINWDC